MWLAICMGKPPLDMRHYGILEKKVIQKGGVSHTIFMSGK